MTGDLEPPPRFLGELIKLPMLRHRTCVRRPLFTHEYICKKWADHDEILSESSFGRGKGCNRFWARSDQTLISMATDSSHRAIMEKMVLPLSLSCFSSDPFYTCR